MGGNAPDARKNHNMVQDLQTTQQSNAASVFAETMKTDDVIQQVAHFLRNEHREERPYSMMNPSTGVEELVFHNEWIKGTPLVNETGISIIVNSLAEHLNRITLLSSMPKDKAENMERYYLLDLVDNIFLNVEKFEIDPMDANMICVNLEDVFIFCMNRTVSNKQMSDKDFLKDMISENRSVNESQQPGGILGSIGRRSGLWGNKS